MWAFVRMLKTRVNGCKRCICMLVVLCAGLAMTAEADQRPFPVVSVSCTEDMVLCRALVQALSEVAPTYIYRINPKPRPPQGFNVYLNLTRDGHAQLRWQETGAGAAIARAGLSETDLARKLVNSSPDLPRALHAKP